MRKKALGTPRTLRTEERAQRRMPSLLGEGGRNADADGDEQSATHRQEHKGRHVQLVRPRFALERLKPNRFAHLPIHARTHARTQPPSFSSQATASHDRAQPSCAGPVHTARLAGARQASVRCRRRPFPARRRLRREHARRLSVWASRGHALVASAKRAPWRPSAGAPAPLAAVSAPARPSCTLPGPPHPPSCAAPAHAGLGQCTARRDCTPLPAPRAPAHARAASGRAGASARARRAHASGSVTCSPAAGAPRMACASTAARARPPAPAAASAAHTTPHSSNATATPRSLRAPTPEALAPPSAMIVWHERCPST